MRQFQFQLTRSRGAWLTNDKCIVAIDKFQLTRSRGAWRSVQKWKPFSQQISTHTLTWSVTLKWYSFLIHSQISTHTLTWSVTISFIHTIAFILHFNSHAHVERDRYFSISISYSIIFQLTRSRGAWRQAVYKDVVRAAISTHTLTWSVTRPSKSWDVFRWFQLTRSRGAWLSAMYLQASYSTFQLTRSRGAWLCNL